MEYPPHLGSGSPAQQAQAQPFVSDDFDVIEWHKHYQSCVRYFLDVAQHSGPVQAAAAFVNIHLPFQNPTHPVHSSVPSARTGPPPSGRPGPSQAAPPPTLAATTSLIPYIRRLVVTGYDFDAVLHSFFGDSWVLGVGPLHETERVNFMFAAKSDSWMRVKQHYDMGEGQTVPFLHSLKRVTDAEIAKAEDRWSEWMAMQDWMLGPQAPGVGEHVARGVGGAGGASLGADPRAFV